MKIFNTAYLTIFYTFRVYLYVSKNITKRDTQRGVSLCGEEPSTNNVTKRGTARLRT